MKLDAMDGASCRLADATTPLPENPVAGMAYVPYQQYCELYAAEQGLENGTIFPELDKPFLGAGRGRR